MKILMVNKFLYPNGGSETYMFKLGAYLKSIGHEVEYFGMADERNCVENREDVFQTASAFIPKLWIFIIQVLLKKSSFH